MDDDLGSKIEKISRLLENKDIMQSLGPLLSALTSKGKNTEADSVSEPEFSSALEDDPVTYAEPLLSPIKKENSTDRNILFSNDSNRDARIDLLNSLKPFCNQERQKRVNTCIQIMGLLKVANLFKDDFQK